jgi:hypothetical protein
MAWRERVRKTCRFKPSSAAAVIAAALALGFSGMVQIYFGTVFQQRSEGRGTVGQTRRGRAAS